MNGESSDSLLGMLQHPMTKISRIAVAGFDQWDEEDDYEFEVKNVEPEEAASNYLWGQFIPSSNRRPLNPYFKLMLEAKKRGVKAFVYNDKVYQGKKHEKLGLIYRKA